MTDDVAGREKLFLAINIIGKVRDHLSSVIAERHAGKSRIAGTGADGRAKEAVWNIVKVGRVMQLMRVLIMFLLCSSEAMMQP
jgi:hypothetical protein